MTIFADTKSFSGFGEYSVYNQREDIMQRCKDIMDIHGENCLIICMNKEDWSMFKKLFAETDYHPQITYYKAPEVMGVESEKRVGILIGLAHKPGHAFDAMRPNARESQILKVESMHADVAQAGARPKDPAGINVSLLFGLGCREEDLYDAFLAVDLYCEHGHSEIGREYILRDTGKWEFESEGYDMPCPECCQKLKET